VLTVFAGIADYAGADPAKFHCRRCRDDEAWHTSARSAKLNLSKVALDRRRIDEVRSAREVAKMFKVHAATLCRHSAWPGDHTLIGIAGSFG
jgi:hypothetical protein